MSRVRVYWNLHRNTFSVQAVETGRVFLHADDLTLTDVRFVVRKGGRDRVLDERRKNVHAFVVGEWDALGTTGLDEGAHVRYNPYQHATFVNLLGEPVLAAEAAFLRKVAGKPQVRLGG